MPPRREENGLLPRDRGRPAPADEIAELHRVGNVGQGAPARRRGVRPDLELLGELHLAAAGPSADIEQPLPVDEPLLLGDRRLEQLRAQRTEKPSLETALLLDRLHRLPVLRHRPLSQHLAGEDEVRPRLLHPPPGQAKHEDPAVDAGVDVGPVAVGRVEEEFEIFRREVDALHGDAERGRELALPVVEIFAQRPGAVDEPAERRLRESHVAGKSPDLDILPPDESDGEHRIEAAGNHADCAYRTHREPPFPSRVPPRSRIHDPCARAQGSPRPVRARAAGAPVTAPDRRPA